MTEVAATAAVQRDGRILLQRRRDIGTWEMPGGRLEPGESPPDAAARECLEECGVEVAPQELAGVYKKRDSGLLVLVFRCEYVAGTPGPSDEATAAGWFDPSDLPEPMLDIVRERITDALGHEPARFTLQTGPGNSTLRAATPEGPSDHAPAH